MRLDVSYRSLLRACGYALGAGDAKAWEEPAAELFGASRTRLALLSVRSGLDALLTALDLPRGSEVLMSALNIPDMETIVRAHGLTPVAVDLAPGGLDLDWSTLEQRVTERSRVLLVAHLFGATLDAGRCAEFARAHDLFFVEDCAQAFAGRTGYLGDEGADASFFSFGLIKTRTALGGGVALVRDARIAARMQAVSTSWPVQSRRAFLRRVRLAWMTKVVTSRLIFGGLRRAATRFGFDLEGALIRSARSFAHVDSLLAGIRQRPSPALLALLGERLRERDDSALVTRRDNGEHLAQLLGLARVPAHAYWLFPVLSADPDAVGERLAAQGFDTADCHSLAVLARADGSCPNAQEFVARVRFLPVYAGLPRRELERMARCLATSQVVRPARSADSARIGLNAASGRS